MHNKKNDEVNKLIYKFINMSDTHKVKFIKKLSNKIDEIDKKIIQLTEKQTNLFKCYFKNHNNLDKFNLNKIYKKYLELISYMCDNKILKLEKYKNKIEINMLYGALVDKKIKGYDIEITK